MGQPVALGAEDEGQAIGRVRRKLVEAHGIIGQRERRDGEAR